MRPATFIASLLFMIVAVAHFVRLCLKVDVMVGSFHVPLWVSIIGVIVPTVLSVFLWREARLGANHICGYKRAGGILRRIR